MSCHGTRTIRYVWDLNFTQPDWSPSTFNMKRSWWHQIIFYMIWVLWGWKWYFQAMCLIRTMDERATRIVLLSSFDSETAWRRWARGWPPFDFREISWVPALTPCPSSSFILVLGWVLLWGLHKPIYIQRYGLSAVKVKIE